MSFLFWQSSYTLWTTLNSEPNQPVSEEAAASEVSTVATITIPTCDLQNISGAYFVMSRLVSFDILVRAHTEHTQQE